MIACTMPLESMWIGNLIPGLSMQEPHRDVPPDKVPPPKHPPDVIPFDPDEEPDFPPGGPPIKDPQPDPEPSMYTRSSLMSASGYERKFSGVPSDFRFQPESGPSGGAC